MNESCIKLYVDTWEEKRRGKEEVDLHLWHFRFLKSFLNIEGHVETQKFLLVNESYPSLQKIQCALL
jgi:hypothetical protein